MRDEPFASIHRLLVIQLDTAAAVDGAIAALQQRQPSLSLALINAQDDNDVCLSPLAAEQVPLTLHTHSHIAIIQWVREQRADAALMLTARGRSPYLWAYRCYLAGIPIRIGQSLEFGGQVLSHWSLPPGDRTLDPHLHLLHTCGLLQVSSPTPVQPIR